MADTNETISIKVQESGTQQIIDLLQQLGLEADEATARVTTGFTRMSTSQQAAVSNQVLLSRGAKDASVNQQALADALDKLTNAELNTANRTGALTTAYATNANAARANAAATQQAAGAQAGAASAATNAASATTRQTAAVNTNATAQQNNARSTQQATQSLSTHQSAVGSLGGAYQALQPVIAAVVGALSIHAFVELSDEVLGLRNRLASVIDPVNGVDRGVNQLNAHFKDLANGTQVVGAGVATMTEPVLDLSVHFKSATQALAAAEAQLDTFNRTGTITGASLSQINAAAGTFDANLKRVSPSIESAVTASQNYYRATEIANVGIAEANNAERLHTQLVNNVRQAMVEATAEQDRLTQAQSIGSSSSVKVATAFRTLGKAIADNGTPLDDTIELFQKLYGEGKSYGVSIKQAEDFTVQFSQQLKAFSPGARQSQAALRELAQGFATGAIPARALQALMREFPQALDPVKEAFHLTTAQMESQGISIQTLIQAYATMKDEIGTRASSAFTTVGQALEGLHTKIELLVFDSPVFFQAQKLLVSAIQTLGDHLPAVTIAIGAFGIAILAVKVAPLIAELITMTGLFNPIVLAIAAVVGAISLFIKGVTDYLVKTGQAKDATDAFYQLLNLLKPAFNLVSIAIGIVKDAFNELLQEFTGSNDTATNLIATLKFLSNVIGAVAIAAAAFTAGFIKDLQYLVQIIESVIGFVKELITLVAGVPGITSKSTGTMDDLSGPISSPIYKRDGEWSEPIYARSGRSFTVPGADRPDTVPVHMVVSKGERVIVQTIDQQHKHDAIMRAANDNKMKFADGGSFVAANSNSTTGYAGFTVGTPYVPDASTVKAATAGTTTTAATQKTATSPPPYDFTGRTGFPSTQAIDKTAYNNSLQPYPGTIATQVGYYQKASDPATVVDQTGSNLTKSFGYGGGAGQHGVAVGVINGVPQPGFGAQIGSQGWGSISFNDYYKKITGHVPESATYNLRGPSSGGPQGATPGNYRDGGTFYARDGLDYDVPGAGGVDSRLMQLAVSPGENVQVRTPDQQAKADQQAPTRGPRAVQVTVVAPDPGAYNRSKTQLARATAKALRRAG